MENYAVIRNSIEVISVEEVARIIKLRWYGHAHRMEKFRQLNKILAAGVERKKGERQT